MPPKHSHDATVYFLFYLISLHFFFRQSENDTAFYSNIEPNCSLTRHSMSVCALVWMLFILCCLRERAHMREGERAWKTIQKREEKIRRILNNVGVTQYTCTCVVAVTTARNMHLSLRRLASGKQTTANRFIAPTVHDCQTSKIQKARNRIANEMWVRII